MPVRFASHFVEVLHVYHSVPPLHHTSSAACIHVQRVLYAVSESPAEMQWQIFYSK